MEEQKTINISIPHDHKPGYANTVKVNVTDEEVILQFAYIREQGQGTLVSELVLSPQHAMRFQKALDDTLKKHFTRHLPQ